MKIFLSGPITSFGCIEKNRKEFHKMEKKLIKKGHVVLNPAKLPDGMVHEEYMIICKAMIRVADTILQLPGWEKSEGAQQENSIARLAGKYVLSPMDKHYL